MESSIDLRADGRVWISERGERVGGCYNSAELLDCDAQVHLTVTIGEDTPPDTVILDLASYHQTNPETGRAFHGRMEINIPLRQIAAIQDFLGLLIKHPCIKGCAEEGADAEHES